MAAKRAGSGGTGTHKARRTGAETPASTTARRPYPERRLVGVDPWAVLLEQLTELPEESASAEWKNAGGE
jgi:hypothetical protein